MFALATALPNVIPTIVDIPWALGEFATDTAFLTMNQIRMALLMAAAHPTTSSGTRSKRRRSAVIVGRERSDGARLARELVGKIPLGGCGLIPEGGQRWLLQARM